MNILDGLKADVTAALSGTLRTATLWHETPGGDDGAGNQLPGTWDSYPCEGVRGSYDAEYAGLSGIPRENSRVELLADTLDVAPERLDVIEIENGFWKIVEIERDPAGALWVCECSETTAVP